MHDSPGVSGDIFFPEIYVYTRVLGHPYLSWRHFHIKFAVPRVMVYLVEVDNVGRKGNREIQLHCLQVNALIDRILHLSVPTHRLETCVIAWHCCCSSGNSNGRTSNSQLIIRFPLQFQTNMSCWVIWIWHPSEGWPLCILSRGRWWEVCQRAARPGPSLIKCSLVFQCLRCSSSMFSAAKLCTSFTHPLTFLHSLLNVWNLH